MMELSLQSLVSLAAFIVQASLKTTLLVLLILLARGLFGRFLTANGRYLLWAPVLISLIIPVGFDAGLPLGQVVEERNVAETLAIPTGSGNAAPVATNPVAPRVDSVSGTLTAAGTPALLINLDGDASSNAVFPWLALLPYAWLAGMLSVLGAIAINSLRLARLVQRATPAPESLQRLLQECMTTTSCHTRLHLLHTQDIQVPMVAGLFKPVLLLPAGMELSVTHAQLRHVFIHELIHIQRNDVLCNWLMALLQSLHWFNPAVWYAFACMREDRELACDAATVQHLNAADRAAYGHTLLQLNDMAPRKLAPTLAVGILGSSSHLRRRVLMLVQNPGHDRLRALLTGILLIPLAVVAFSQPVVDDKNQTAAEKATPVAPTQTSLSVVAVQEAPATAAPDTETLTTASPAIREALPVTAAQPVSATPDTVTAAASEPERPVANTLPVMQEPARPATNTRPVIQEPARPATNTRPVIQEPSRSAADIRTNISGLPTTQTPQLLAQNLTPDTVLPAPDSVPPDASNTIEPAAGVNDIFADVKYIQLMADALVAVQADRIDFIETWDALGEECAAREDSFFGALSGACQRIRTALRRGDIFRFAAECFQLNSLQVALHERYREMAVLLPAPAGIEAALLSNEHMLAAFCSKDTYSKQYPAFAAIFSEAESQGYTQPGTRVKIPIEAMNFYSHLGNTFVNASSMVPGEYTPPPIEPTPPYVIEVPPIPSQ